MLRKIYHYVSRSGRYNAYCTCRVLHLARISICVHAYAHGHPVLATRLAAHPNPVPDPTTLPRILSRLSPHRAMAADLDKHLSPRRHPLHLPSPLAGDTIQTALPVRAWICDMGDSERKGFGTVFSSTRVDDSLMGKRGRV